MKVYGVVNNEDAPLLSSKGNGTKANSSNFKRVGVATLLASGAAAFAIASGSNNGISGASSSSSMMRLGDALDDAKAGALLKFFLYTKERV